MEALKLHEFHRSLGARFVAIGAMETVADYGEMLTEHAALRESAGVLDLGFRSRLCLIGADRARFLHGQATNDVKSLKTGEGCYAALVTAKGKMESDLNIYCLPEELLLDFEPGFVEVVRQRLEKFIIADDVQVVEVAPHYGLLSVQGPRAEAIVNGLRLFKDVPPNPWNISKAADEALGEIYLANQPRLGTTGFDLFIPIAALGTFAEKLVAIVSSAGGRPCGWQALEAARIEAGIPRFGTDMDGTNLPLECGIEARAVSYTKGCYIGQEVLNRIHTIGHVNKELRGLRLAEDLPALPVKGDKLFHKGKEAGYVTSALASPMLRGNIALGYVRRECNQPGTEVILRMASGESPARVVQLPFTAKTVVEQQRNKGTELSG
jgi:aminomethyltransferase